MCNSRKQSKEKESEREITAPLFLARWWNFYLLLLQFNKGLINNSSVSWPRTAHDSWCDELPKLYMRRYTWNYVRMHYHRFSKNSIRCQSVEKNYWGTHEMMFVESKKKRRRNKYNSQMRKKNSINWPNHPWSNFNSCLSDALQLMSKWWIYLVLSSEPAHREKLCF